MSQTSPSPRAGEEEKKSVLLYTEWAQPLEGLSLEQKGRIFEAILRYADGAPAPALEDPATRMAFAFIQLRLEENMRKWETTRQRRREAGRRGGKQSHANSENAAPAEPEEAKQENTSCAEQSQANQANASFAEQTQANQAVNENVNVNANVNVNGNGNENVLSSSSSKSPSSPKEPVCAPDGAMTTTTTTISPLEFYVENGFGKASDYIAQQLEQYRRKGVDDGLLIAAMQQALDHGAPKWIYARKVLDQAVAAGTPTLDQWRRVHLAYKSAVRVDREQPSGNDFLRDAAMRQRRLKRRDAAG